MTDRAADRAGLRGAWEAALRRGEEGVRLVQEVSAPKAAVPRDFLFSRTLKALVFEALFTGLFAMSQTMDAVRARATSGSLKPLLVIFGVAMALGMLVMLPRLVRAGWLFVRHGPIAPDLLAIGRALLRALHRADAIRTPVNEMRVSVRTDDYGAVRCSLEGGSSYEKSVFLGALEELLNPIENPRYLLLRRSKLWKLRRRDYLAVPRELGRRKENAEYFARMWRKYVGSAQVIYTRRPEGRQALLEARARSLSAAFRPRSERVSAWR
jgi:hypothetical protein